jgi:hypothetical protein
VKSRQTKTVKALALTALTLSLSAIFVPLEQFAVAIFACILAIVAGFCGEVVYTTATAAVTALNMAMLSPHDDLVMTERPVQVYWTALLWAAAPMVSIIGGYLIRLLSRQESLSPRGSEQGRKPQDPL